MKDVFKFDKEICPYTLGHVMMLNDKNIFQHI